MASEATQPSFAAAVPANLTGTGLGNLQDNGGDDDFAETLDDLETLEGLERLEALAENDPLYKELAYGDPFEPAPAPQIAAPAFPLFDAGGAELPYSSSARASAKAPLSAFSSSESESLASVPGPWSTSNPSENFSPDAANSPSDESGYDSVSASQASESRPSTSVRPRAGAASKKSQSGDAKEDADDEEKGASGAPETSQERKERMAAACRRFRAKRKVEIAHLKERNHELELARTEYQNRIADLQLEAQMLRGEGEVHLRKENELLRVEIRRYKRFIKTIVDAASTAAKVQPEEKYRLLCEGIESASGQVMGLLYTSVRDSSWIQGDTVMLGDVPVTIRFQHLPLGASAISSTRTNLRLDVALAIPPERAYKAIWESWLSFNVVQEFVQKHMPSVNVKQEELEPDFGGDGEWNDDNVKIVRFAETLDGKSQDSIHAYTRREGQVVFPSGFYDLPDKGLAYSPVPSEAQKAYVVMQSCGTAITQQAVDIAPPREGVDRLDKTVLEAYVIRPGPQGGSFWTGIVSFPNIGCTMADVEPAPFALDDGTISAQGIAYFTIQRDIIRSHGSLNDIDNDCALQ